MLINVPGAITGLPKVFCLHVSRHVRVGARVFGDLKDPESAVDKILDKERINLLKPNLGTKPKLYYVGLDREVR